MIESINNKSASEIAKSYFLSRKSRNLKSEIAEDYFIELRDAIINEYSETGYCSFIDNYLYRKGQQCDYLILSAAYQIRAKHKYVKGESGLIPIPPELPTSYRPTWDDVYSPRWACFRCDDFFMPVNEEGHKLHLRRINEIEKKPDIIPVRIDEIVDNTVLTDHSLELFKQSEAELSAIVDRNRDTVVKAEMFHDQMCAKTNELQKALLNVTEEMKTIKEEFYDHLHKWQKGLYPHEFGALAERYTELYRILDVEKTIAKEVQEIQNEQNEGTLDKTLMRLEKLDSTLHTFLRKYEASLNGLGLYVYRAEEGETFDYGLYECEDGSIECDGKTVKACIVPGVARRSGIDGEVDVIIPALVSV